MLLKRSWTAIVFDIAQISWWWHILEWVEASCLATMADRIRHGRGIGASTPYGSVATRSRILFVHISEDGPKMLIFDRERMVGLIVENAPFAEFWVAYSLVQSLLHNVVWITPLTPNGLSHGQRLLINVSVRLLRVTSLQRINVALVVNTTWLRRPILTHDLRDKRVGADWIEVGVCFRCEHIGGGRIIHELLHNRGTGHLPWIPPCVIAGNNLRAIVHLVVFFFNAGDMCSRYHLLRHVPTWILKGSPGAIIYCLATLNHWVFLIISFAALAFRGSIWIQIWALTALNGLSFVATCRSLREDKALPIAAIWAQWSLLYRAWGKAKVRLYALNGVRSLGTIWKVGGRLKDVSWVLGGLCTLWCGDDVAASAVLNRASWHLHYVHLLWHHLYCAVRCLKAYGSLRLACWLAERSARLALVTVLLLRLALVQRMVSLVMHLFNFK